MDFKVEYGIMYISIAGQSGVSALIRENFTTNVREEKT